MGRSMFGIKEIANLETDRFIISKKFDNINVNFLMES